MALQFCLREERIHGNPIGAREHLYLIQKGPGKGTKNTFFLWRANIHAPRRLHENL